MDKKLHFPILVAPVLSVALVLVPWPTRASTVTNTVSVSAHSDTNGQSSIESTIIVNGEVVDQVKKTGTGSLNYQYSLSTTTDSSRSTTGALNANNEDLQEALQALVVTLRHYVSYLTSLLAATTPGRE